LETAEILVARQGDEVSKVWQWPWRRVAIAGLCAAGLLAEGAGTAGAAVHARADERDPGFYLALGGSGSVGFQPTAARPHGQHTDMGYANDLLEAIRPRWGDLKLVEFGCPGETTATMLDGGGRCHYASGSQLGDAISFLRRHSSTVLVTVDLGFNDVLHCMERQVVDQACVSTALENVRLQLPRILQALQSATPPDMHIVGVDHYDPYLSASLDSPAGATFAPQSLEVIERLDGVIGAAYAAARIPMANVAEAFDMTSTVPTWLSGTGLVPQNVARVCALTWACVRPPLGPNAHPNDAGYRVISDAIGDVLSRS
jgi:lysophospholipase L1-like esterase